MIGFKRKIYDVDVKEIKKSETLLNSLGYKIHYYKNVAIVERKV